MTTITMRLEYAAVTDIGPHRATNQDAFLANEILALFAVADGMGGPPGGDVASRTAVMALFNYAAAHIGMPSDKLLPGGFHRAQDGIHSEVELNPHLTGMGTTLVAVRIVGAMMTIAHIGDSRAYHHRSGVLRPLTEDHSVVNLQVRQGRLSAETARHDPRRHILNRVVGYNDSSEPDLATVALAPGDQALLCTDGLTGPLDNADIERHLSRTGPPLETCRRLVRAALDAGGLDNVTVLLVRTSS